MSDEYDSDYQEKKAHHNALEGERRDEIKECFTSLRDAVPSIRGKSVTRNRILKSTASFIRTTTRKNSECRKDIKQLQEENREYALEIEKLTRLLKQTKKMEHLRAGKDVLLDPELQLDDYSDSSISSDDDDDDDDEGASSELHV